jgi:hypothetical protein
MRTTLQKAGTRAVTGGLLLFQRVAALSVCGSDSAPWEDRARHRFLKSPSKGTGAATSTTLRRPGKTEVGGRGHVHLRGGQCTMRKGPQLKDDGK